MANESRKSRALRQQNPGMASTGRVDPAAGARARRAAAGEQAAGLRYRQGLRVQDDGSLEVHTDATLRVDQRQQLGVRNKFDTPTKDTQAANKAYVDDAIASIVTGSAWQSVTMLPEERTNLGGSGYVVVGQSSNVHYFGALADLDNLAGVGPNGLQLATGYYWVLRQQVLVGNQSGGTRTVEVRLVQDQGGSIIVLTSFETAIGNGFLRTINLETISSGGDDVYLEVGATSATNAGIVIDSARLHAQLLELRNDPDIAGSLPPPLGITASFSAESLTAVAWTDDVAFLQTSVGDADTFTWTFDEWGPTYMTYSGAYGSLVSHRFMDGGTHTVELTASGPSGSDTATVDVVVQDVVETQNILASVGILDATDFDDIQTNVASQSVSSIAAPDGTLTAIETVATSSTVQPSVRALLFETTGTYTQIGDLWQNGLAWTFAIYAYMGQANADRIVLQVVTRTTAGVASDLVTVTVLSGSVVGFTSTSTGSVAYSAERNARVEAVGDTGWYRIEITLQDYARTCDRIYLQIYGTSSIAQDRFITWNPTLRYGDWVSRGKNRQGTPLIDWAITAGASKAYSATAAPDGTLSAVQTSLPAGGNCDISATNAIAAAVPAYASVTLEAYINHSDGDWDSGRIYHYLRSSSAFPEMVYIDIDPAGGFAASLVTLATSGPGYTTAEHAEATQIGTNGWWRYRLTITDYGGTALTTWNYLRAANSAGATRGVFWGPRITVGNPADARGYFVSGPQNLLGDGSDYSGWTAGTN